MGPDLRTRYLGLELSNPVVASVSPRAGEFGTLKRLEEAGVSAVVMPSPVEEQIENEPMEIHRLLEQGSHCSAEASTYFPALEGYSTEPDAYLRRIEAAKAALSVPVIANVCGCSLRDWARFASLIESAGADALELSVCGLETDTGTTGDAVEERILVAVRAVREQVRIPLAVGVSPGFSALAHTAARLVDAGANGLVLFRRFAQLDIDLESFKLIPQASRSSHDDLFLPLRWIGILSGRIDTSLAATGGIHEPEDVVKVLLAGADIAITESALLRDQPERLERLLTGLRAWLAEHEYESVAQLKGSMCQLACPNPVAFERAEALRALTPYFG